MVRNCFSHRLTLDAHVRDAVLEALDLDVNGQFDLGTPYPVLMRSLIDRLAQSSRLAESLSACRANLHGESAS